MSTMRQLLLLAVVCWASTYAQSHDGEAYKAEDFPNPLWQPVMCGRGEEKSFICDPSRILKSEEDYFCTKVEAGYKIGIALVKRMLPSDSAQTAKSQEDPSFVINQNLHESRLFSYTLLKRWDMGQCEEDVIILYSVVDNVFYTLTGNVAAKKLTASIIGDIAMNTREMFRPSTVFEGLLSLVKQYQAVFQGRYERPTYKLQMPEAQAVRSHAGFLLPSLISLLLGLLAAVH